MRRSRMTAASTARRTCRATAPTRRSSPASPGNCRKRRSGSVSNLRRTHQTAPAIVAPACPARSRSPAARAGHPRLAEQNFGDWQGLTYEELRHSRGGAFHRFWHAPAHERAPGGESFVEMMARVDRAILGLIEQHRGHDIIAVAHGGTIRSALGYGAGPRARALPGVHDGELLADPHRPYRGAGHGSQLAGDHRQPPAEIAGLALSPAGASSESAGGRPAAPMAVRYRNKSASPA